MMSTTIELMTLINLFLMIVVLGLTATAICTLLFGVLSGRKSFAGGEEDAARVRRS